MRLYLICKYLNDTLDREDMASYNKHRNKTTPGDHDERKTASNLHRAARDGRTVQAPVLGRDRTVCAGGVSGRRIGVAAEHLCVFSPDSRIRARLLPEPPHAGGGKHAASALGSKEKARLERVEGPLS